MSTSFRPTKKSSIQARRHKPPTLPPAPSRTTRVEHEYFREVLGPNDFLSRAELEQRLLAFQSHYEQSASPFKWTFTRRDLHALLAKIVDHRLASAA